MVLHGVMECVFFCRLKLLRCGILGRWSGGLT